MVLCFKLYFSQDGTTSNTASAAIRQGVAVVIDRMIEEDKIPKGIPHYFDFLTLLHQINAGEIKEF